MDAIRGTLDSI
jgi:trimeric autotransporter adhesin